MIAAELLNGTMIDNRYRLTRAIGKGSYGWVYEAVEEMAGQFVGQVAVKLLAPEDDTQRDMVLREIRALAGLTHEFIIGYRTSGLIQEGPLKGMIFLVTELGDCPLSQRIPPQDPLPEAEIWRMGRGVALALAHIEAKQSVHRDVKPENVLRVNGCWKLGDFGLVRAVEGAQMSASGAKGTLRYMAPEALNNEVTAATDVYALGVTLLRCLTGCYAHEGESEGEFIANLMTKAARLPRELPAAWGPILDGCLQRDPRRRFSAAQLAQQLELGPRVVSAVLPPLPREPSELPTQEFPRQFQRQSREDRTMQLEDPTPWAHLSTERPPVIQRIPRRYPPASELRLADDGPEEKELRQARINGRHPKRSALRVAFYALTLLLVIGGATVLATRSGMVRDLADRAVPGPRDLIGTEEMLELTVLATEPVHVRLEPRAGARSLGTVGRDAVIKTFGKEGGWYKIATPTGAVAWIHEAAFTGVGSEDGAPASSRVTSTPVDANLVLSGSDPVREQPRGSSDRLSATRRDAGGGRVRGVSREGRTDGPRAQARRARVLHKLQQRCRRNPALPVCQKLRRGTR